MTRSHAAAVLTRSGALAIACLLACAGAASAQNALGDGRALDRNLHANDGRINPTGTDIRDQIRFNNAVITGNAANGKSFRGGVGYRAVDEFGGRLGSDDLFSFRRDSAASNPFGTGVRGTDAVRYQFAGTTGQNVPSYLSQSRTYGRDSAAVSGSPSLLRSTSDYLTSQSTRPSFVGSRIDEQGYEFTAKASPLSGLSWVRSARPVVRIARPEDRINADDLGAVRKAPSEQEPIDSSRQIPGATGFETTTPGLTSPFDRETYGVTRAPSGKVEALRTDAHARVYEAFQTALGSETPTGRSPKPAEGAPVTPADARTGDTTKTVVDNSIDAQLERLRSGLRGDSAPTGSARSPLGEAQGAEAPTPAAQPFKPETGLKGILKSSESTRSNSTQPNSTRPGTAQASRGEKTGDKVGAGADAGPKDVRTLSTGQTLNPTLNQALRSTGNIRLDQLAKREAPPPKGVVNQPAYIALMEQGEAALVEGRYFDAEDRYTRAMAALPGDAMAKIGRAHAQLGAGLYLSAAANLRSVFADSPELLGASFGERLIPTAARTEFIAKSLREEIDRGGSALGRDGGFLLGYLGHLRADQALVNQGLFEMGKRLDANNPADMTLLEGLKAAWLK